MALGSLFWRDWVWKAPVVEVDFRGPAEPFAGSVSSEFAGCGPTPLSTSTERAHCVAVVKSLDSIAGIAAPSERARAAHDRLLTVEADRTRLLEIRREAVAQLRRDGWTWRQVAELLGVHRNRAAHLLDGLPRDD